MQSDHDPLLFLSQPGLEQIEAYRRAHETQLLVLLITDLESSTRQQAYLGNVRAAEIVQLHRRIFRGVLAKMDGQEVETAGDSFLTVFAAPSEAVLFALRMQRAMRQAQIAEPELPSVRVGIHLGQVVVERHEGGPKAMDLYGLQVSTAARIMDLATGGQILCSREVFNNARSILRGDQLAGLDEVAWKNHGPYVFKGVESEAGSPDSYEVCEAGEVGHAPLEKPAGSAKSHPADEGDEIFGWRPGPDAILPGTSWQLERKLGEGGFGEVWLARDKGGRETVFKFCTKKSKLRSLRREYEVFNALVKDGKSPPGIAEVIEARDDRDGDPPYYIRLAYVAGGDLKDWIEQSAANASLRMQLDLALQMARAVARIHAAGFVHRDIKPSNFLVEPEDDPNRAPTLRLCDFGIGHEVLKDAIKDGANTRDLAGGGGQFTVGSQSFMQAAGTFVFIAPELQMGSASTPGKLSKDALPAADMYSLGVTLYQLFTASTDRAPGVGLADVNDPILRDDIAACLDSDPAKRPTATELAERLERYDERTRERERAVQRERSRRQRVALGIVTAVALVMFAFAAFAALQWQEAQAQRQQAETERERAEAQQRVAEASTAKAENLNYLSSMQLFWVRLESDQYQLAREALWRTPADLRNWEWGYAFNMAYPGDLVLRGHASFVESVSASPDGLHILTASSDGTVRVWDAQTGSAIHIFEGPEKGVLSASYSPDGRRIAAASEDGAVRVYDSNTGRQLGLLEGHAGRVLSASFSPDGQQIVTASGDGTARVWDSNTFAELALFGSRDFVIFHAMFHPEGTQILTAGADNAARVWDLSTGAEVAVLEGHQDSITGAAFNVDGTLIVTASRDKTARLWDVRSGAVVRVFHGHTDAVRSAFFSDDGAHIVTSSWDKTARVWSVASDSHIAVLKGHEKELTSAIFNQNGTCILTSSWDMTARVWNLEHVWEQESICQHSGRVWSAAFSPDESHIVTASEDGTARVWDSTTGQAVHILSAHEGPVYSARFSPDGRLIVTTSADHTARLWDVTLGSCVNVLRGHEGSVLSASFSPDGQRIVTSSTDFSARIWDAATGTELAVLSGHQKMVVTAIFGPSGDKILTASRDHHARLWDAHSGEELVVLRGHEDELNGAIFSPDGTRILTVSRDNTARIWDASSGAQLVTLNGHNAWVYNAFYSFDGSRIVTASHDGTARIWDAFSGEELGVLQGHEEPVNSAIFSSDGTRIVTVSGNRWYSENKDRTIRVWDADTASELAVLEGHSDIVEAAIFSPDGRRIVSASKDGTARVWSAAPWRLEDLPPVEGTFDTPEAEREARFYEWKRQEYQNWLAEASGTQTRVASRVARDIVDAIGSTGGDSHE